MFPNLTRDDVFRLETERLWLRWPRAADAARIRLLASDAAVAETTGAIPHPYPPESADAFVIAARTANAEGSGLVLALTPKNGARELIGMTGIEIRDGAAELGYWLGRSYWRSGLASEAARALIGLAFSVSRIETLEAGAFPDNAASRRLLERLGFMSAGRVTRHLPLRGGPRAVERYILPRDRWPGVAEAPRVTRQPAFPSSRLLPPSPTGQTEAGFDRGAFEPRRTDWSGARLPA